MKQITLLDGAVGTSLWAIAEREGVEKVPVWRYNVEHPEFVEELHRRYVKAGSQIILSNTFGANGPIVARASKHSVHDVVFEGVRIAKKAVEGTDIKVALAIGPLSQMMEPYGDLEEEEVEAIYEEQIAPGIEAGADIVYLMTFIDINMMVVAARVAKKFGKPVFCTMSFEKVGKTMFGNSVQTCIDELEPLGIDGIGMNCSIGPELAVPIMKTFVGKTNIPLVFKPNAGLPITNADGTVIAPYDAAKFTEEIAPAFEFVDYIGGCCGSDPSYVEALKAKME